MGCGPGENSKSSPPPGPSSVATATSNTVREPAGSEGDAAPVSQGGAGAPLLASSAARAPVGELKLVPGIWIHGADIHGAAWFVGHVYDFNIGVIAGRSSRIWLDVPGTHPDPAVRALAKVGGTSHGSILGITWLADEAALRRGAKFGSRASEEMSRRATLGSDSAGANSLAVLAARLAGVKLRGVELRGVLTVRVHQYSSLSLLWGVIAMSGARYELRGSAIVLQSAGELPDAAREPAPNCPLIYYDVDPVHRCTPTKELCVGAVGVRNDGNRLALLVDSRGAGRVAREGNWVGLQPRDGSIVVIVSIRRSGVTLNNGDVISLCEP
ncbi:uncharacterized protein CMC5_023590 [Chondromyces crocatus]|uniref:Uncharacterized protein n=1 Tax=Chondromyces crocatus TaxID=52 RepID=A0A0K1EBF8_CHOCO|nr:uncharacterized protein CMC5_023590 [Chondromyces crocatus]